MFGTTFTFRCLLIAMLIFVNKQFSTAQLTLSMDESVAVALSNHPMAKNALLAEQKDMLSQKQSVELAPVQAKHWHINANDGNDRLWSVTQDFGIIPEHVRRVKHGRLTTSANRTERALTLDELTWQVKAAYLNLVCCKERLSVMQEHDRYFEALINTAEIYLASDTIDELVRVSTGARYAAYQSSMYIAEEEAKRAEARLRQLLYTDEPIDILQTKSRLYEIHPDRNPADRFEPVNRKAADHARSEVAKSTIAVEKSKLFPAVHAGYINQYIPGTGNYGGWMLGISVPLWWQPQLSRIKQAEIDFRMKENETKYNRFSDLQHTEMLKSLLNEYFVQISFSSENLLTEAELILAEIEKQFAEGKINNHAATFTKAHNAISAKLNHLEYINQYNQTALELEFYTR